MHKHMIGRLSVVMVAGGLAACTTVGAVGYPGEFVATHSPAHVWVTQAGKDGMMDLYNPTLHGDTLAGFDKNGGFYELPIGDVQLMRAPMAAPAKTALLAASIAIGSALIITNVQGSSAYCANFAPGSSNNGLVQPCGTIYGKPNT